jgi:hypothetical protein
MTREDINTLIRQMTEEAGTYQRVGTATTFRTAKMLSCAAILLADMQRERESEYTVAAEVMLLEAEREIDRLRRESTRYKSCFNSLVFVIEQLNLASREQFFRGVNIVANELKQDIETK